LETLRGDVASRRYEEAVLTIRRIMQLSVRAVLLAREKTGISKEKHEYRAVAKHLKESEVREYRGLMNVEDANEDDARRTIEGAADLMKWVLEGYSLSPALVDYGKR